MRRGILRLILLLGVPVAALVTGAHYWVQSARYVRTENAYVKSNVVQVAAEVAGRVERVFVSENGFVRAGQAIFSIDPEPFRVAFKQAEARLAMVRNDVRALRASYREAEEEIKEAEQNIDYLERVYDRLKSLVGRGHASRAAFDEAERNVATARQRAGALREKGLKILASLGGSADLAVESHAEYLAALAARESAEIALRRSVVYAPVDGTIGRLRLQVGEYVAAGQPVMPLIETTRPWIEANLKETQLTHVRVGQRAEVVVDAYPDLVWVARVASISPTTGAELAVLPPQNASGNWVKVVQRVPVRLEVEAASGRSFTMPAGVTVSVSIDTERERSLFDVVGSALAFKARRE